MPSFNSAQRYLLITGFLGAMTLLIFPPWQEITVIGQYTRFRSLGHAFFMNPPEALGLNQNIEIAWSILSLYLSLCVVGTGITCFIFSDIARAAKFTKTIVQTKLKIMQLLHWLGNQNFLELTKEFIYAVINALLKMLPTMAGIFGPIVLMLLIPVLVDKFTPYKVLPWVNFYLLSLGIGFGLAYAYWPRRNALTEGNKLATTGLEEAGNKFIIASYRSLAAKHSCAPTSKTSDLRILEIYKKVCADFRETAERRGEQISAGHLNYIAWKFLQANEMLGSEIANEHLSYETEKYLNEGLREDYKQHLSLITHDLVRNFGADH